MSIILGKIAWSLLSPGSVLFALLILALVMSWWSSTRRWGRRLGMIVLAATLAFGILPVFDWLVRPLEEYYPIPKLPPIVDGILVLGGSEDAALSAARHQPQVGSSADRLISFVGLARRYPNARLVFSGRGIDRQPDSMSEADVAREVFIVLGLDVGRVVFENESRNTIENAEKSKALVMPKPGETWLLVTSAAHMPRAVNCFRAVGWAVLPYPVDYQTGGKAGFGFSPLGGFGRLNGAVKEWAALLAYRLLGRTRDILPPRDLQPAGPAAG